MNLPRPTPTPYDVHFRLLGIPARIHPAFWLVALLSGPIGMEPRLALFAMAITLASLVAHELGHALVHRRFCGRPGIVLYWLGGQTSGAVEDPSSLAQVLISLAGPAVNLFVFVAAMGCLAAAGCQPRFSLGIDFFTPFQPETTSFAVAYLLYVNLWWALINLLPVYPLDGGRVLRELLLLVTKPERAIIASLGLSVGVAGVVSLWLLYRAAEAGWSINTAFPLVFFIFLTFQSYASIDAYRQSRGPGW